MMLMMVVEGSSGEIKKSKVAAGLVGHLLLVSSLFRVNMLYRVGMVVGYWVGLTLYFDIPLPAKSCLGRWKFGRIGWSVGHYGGTPKSK